MGRCPEPESLERATFCRHVDRLGPREDHSQRVEKVEMEGQGPAKRIKTEAI